MNEELYFGLFTRRSMVRLIPAFSSIIATVAAYALMLAASYLYPRIKEKVMKKKVKGIYYGDTGGNIHEH
jgi:hypothetical protein